MDPDLQMKVHFNAAGVHRFQKRFLNQSVHTKAKLMTTLQKRIPVGKSHNRNHMTIFLRLCDQLFFKAM